MRRLLVVRAEEVVPGRDRGVTMHETHLEQSNSEGVAMLFSGDPETGECSCDTFREADFADPQRAAEALRESCAADFPGRMWSIALNERARRIMVDRRVKEWIG